MQARLSLYTAHGDPAAAAAAAAASAASALLAVHIALWRGHSLRWHSVLHQRSGPRQPPHCLSGRARDPRVPQTLHSRGAGPRASGPCLCSGGRRRISSASARTAAQGPCCDWVAAGSAASAPAASSAERPHACCARAFTAAAAWHAGGPPRRIAGSTASCGGGTQHRLAKAGSGLYKTAVGRLACQPQPCPSRGQALSPKTAPTPAGTHQVARASRVDELGGALRPVGALQRFLQDRRRLAGHDDPGAVARHGSWPERRLSRRAAKGARQDRIG
jgi:hypothetical protein